MHPKINLLAFAAHPDDVEISASGTMIKHQKNGLTTGIIDLTKGELGTRGNAETRAKESAISSEILKLTIRENLGLADGYFENNSDNLNAVIKTIRKYQPDMVLINAYDDRHPDHAKGHQLVKQACFLSGLPKIELLDENNNSLEAWRPKTIFSYIQDYYLKPDIVIDVTEYWSERMKALMAYQSQFYNPNSNEPETPISSKEFLNHIEGRSTQFGRYIGVTYGEGFNVVRPIGTEFLSNLY